MFIVDDQGRIIRQFQLPDYSFESCFQDWYLCGVAKLYRRALHERWGYYDEKLLAPDHLTRMRAERRKQPVQLSRDERRRVMALVALCALNIVFWAVYEQQGNTMQSWADERTRWPNVLGFSIPSTWFQSFNPLIIILFAPLLDLLWAHQQRRGREPSSVAKMALGCTLLGASFVVMIVGAQVVADGKGSMLWLLSCTLLLTLGELYLSPVGLSLVTKVAPARIVSMMLGMWFLSSFAGNFLSGAIGVLYTRWSPEAFFALLTALGIGTGLAIWAFNKPLRGALEGSARPD